MGTLTAAQAQTDVTVSKKLGKFQTTLYPQNAYGFDGTANAPGFIESTELDISWWWLFDQPVYYHTLRWNLLDVIKVEQYSSFPIYLNRNDLREYPDLLKRFDDLRPLHMEITFDVTLQQGMISSKVGKFGTYFDKYNEFKYRRTIKDVELMIAKSGKNGENISAGSPPDGYRGFTDYAVKADRYKTKKEVEKRLYGTFVNTGTIVFRNAYISKLRLPNTEIKSIYDTMMKRKRGCGKYKDNPLAWTCKEKKKPQDKEQQPHNTDTDSLVSENSFWENGGVTKQRKNLKDKTTPSPTSITASDFWKDGGKAESKTTNTILRASDSDGFWADGGRRKSGQGDSFWQDGAQGDLEEGFEIKTVDGKQGVVASSGRMLIPFRKWEIVSYSAGMAKVLISESQVVGRCARGSDIFTYSVVASSTGYVDQIGDWVIPPERVVRPSYSEYTPLVLTSTRSGATYEEKERAKERRERRREKERREFRACKSDIKTSRLQIYRSYEAKGFVVKS